MIRLLIPLSVVLFAIGSILTRFLQIRYPDNRSILRFYQMLYCFVAAVIFFLQGGIGATVVGATFASGLSFGVLFAAATLFSATGMECGPMSLTSVVCNLSFLIPTVYATVADGQGLTATKYVGLLLIVGLFAVIAIPGKKIEQGTTAGGIAPIWYPIVLVAFFSNGLTAVIQKKYGADYPDLELSAMMAIAYLTATFLFLGCYLYEQKKHPQTGATPRDFGLTGLYAVGTGFGSFGGNYLLGILCNEVEGTVLYPCLNGGLCILVSVISFLVFKEKMTKSKAIAISLGIAAIIVLNL